MTYLDTDSELWKEVESIAADEAQGLYDLELQGGCKLCVVLSPGADGSGVSSGDCSRVCRRLMVYFQTEAKRFNLPEEVEIDVSSPGVNRTLRLERHFVQAVGERVKITVDKKSTEAADTSDEAFKEIVKRGFLRGILDQVDSGELRVRDDKSKLATSIPFSLVKTARVDFDFDATK